MLNKPLIALGLFVGISLVACSRGLTEDEAKSVIGKNSLIRQSDHISVDAISTTNAAEAVVRATIEDQTTNLKFRRFDKGWAWEFAETKTGEWVTPDVAIAQIREERSGELSHDAAKKVIEGNSLIRATDDVSVDAISATSPAEAVVRATIDGQTTNLKFRHFDKGWTWEFVETKAGGWIAPDVAIAQIREEHRGAAATKWAEQHKAGYASTAYTMSLMALYNIPNPTMRLDLAGFEKMRSHIPEFFKNRTDMDEKDRRARIAVLTNDHLADAWGSQIETRFSKENSDAVIVSAGPDKTMGTEDDLDCYNTFTRGYEDGREIWNQIKTWSVPEGLGSAVTNKYFDKDTNRIEYTKVVKP